MVIADAKERTIQPRTHHDARFAETTTAITREVDFTKLSPTQNMTLLIRSAHPVEEYRAIARELMSAGHVHAEQVGFVEQPRHRDAHARLHMAADEFCGNACMSMAVLHAAERHLDLHQTVLVPLETSGAAGIVRCEVQRRATDHLCRLAMPLPHEFASYPVAAFAQRRSTLVRYEDAVHLVVEVDRVDHSTSKLAEQTAMELAQTWQTPLVGVMLHVPGTGQLAPLIHLPALDSLLWENSCGSGMASLGVHLARTKHHAVNHHVSQPGGTMRVDASYDHGTVTDIHVTGAVTVVAEGRAYVHV